MGQPVKLSDALVLDARIAGEAQERSIAGQVEFWAKLGRSVEMMLEGEQIMKLCRTVGAKPLSELVDAADALVGREMLKSYLDSEPYPHFEAHPTQAGVLIRWEEDGEALIRTVGKFVDRKFVPQKEETARGGIDASATGIGFLGATVRGKIQRKKLARSVAKIETDPQPSKPDTKAAQSSSVRQERTARKTSHASDANML